MGSSPRMRGTRHHARLETVETGIIPAYAGNTRERHGTVSDRRDHPRVCGEHKRLPRTHTTRPGSSPRMRGTLQRSLDMWYFIGIIPAYAGNTQSNTMRGASVWDHPRVCGEHLTGNPYLLMVQGSSPRMRGTLGFSVTNTNDAGIIPAYAGNTWRPSSNLRCVRDHPRVCGEHEAFGTSASKAQGSSPRMRGTLVARIPEEIRGWIIPAYAGNTIPQPARRGERGDHPRVCGEHHFAYEKLMGRSGSSPRMRGTLWVSVSERDGHGIIPAYAGNTLATCPIHLGTWDHPRVCGEHLLSRQT